MWDYIYFHLYLETIDISDHNAIESYVYKKVRWKELIDVSIPIYNDHAYVIISEFWCRLFSWYSYIYNIFFTVIYIHFRYKSKI